MDANKSYYQIIRSTGILGGAQLVNILIGIIRNKISVVFLGDIGMGLISIYQSVLDLIKSITCLGIDVTGVREVAMSSEDSERLVGTVSVIYKWIWILAFFSGIVGILFSPLISRWAFGSADYSQNIALLSVSLFFNLLALGELVILQGLRRIGYMVKSSLIGSLLTLVLIIPLYCVFNLRGIVPAFILGSIVTYLAVLYYRKKIGIQIVSVSFKDLLVRGRFVFRIGFFIILATIQTQITLFFVKSMVISRLGLEQLGLVQAVWTITNVYLTLILKSMSADFYPKLSAICEDDEKIKRLINEQVYVILVLSLPIILFLMVFSKMLLSLLYSDSFESVYTVLNWRSIGIFFKIITWALGFVLLAKGKGFLYFLSDVLYSVIYLSCIYFLFPTYNLDSIGIAYLLAYVVYAFVVYRLLRKTINFRWQTETVKVSVASFFLILVVFCAIAYNSSSSRFVAIVLLVISVVYSFLQFNKVMNLKNKKPH